MLGFQQSIRLLCYGEQVPPARYINALEGALSRQGGLCAGLSPIQITEQFQRNSISALLELPLCDSQAVVFEFEIDILMRGSLVIFQTTKHGNKPE